MASGYAQLSGVIHRLFNRAGFEISRIERSPRYSWLGLSRLPICAVIDVGANRGQFASAILELFPEARVICCEPLDEPVAALKQWAATQKRGQVTVIQTALGDRDGTAGMFLHSDHDASSSLLRSTETTETLYPFTRTQQVVPVNLTTLDAICQDLTIEGDLLVKIDTQGYERQVIVGGHRTLRQARACIVEVNLYTLYESQAVFGELIGLLDAAGLSYAGNLEQTYDREGRVVYLDAVFIRPTEQTV